MPNQGRGTCAHKQNYHARSSSRKKFVSGYVDKELISTAKKFMKEVSEFEDTQSAFPPDLRAVHFMRTTPFHHWSAQAQHFDNEVRDTVETLLGSPLTPQAYKQACISSRFGGLGMRRLVDHAHGAFSASWRESARECGESWSLPPNYQPDFKSQSQASEDTDKTTLELMITHSDVREAQRLRRLDSIHANAWITALPSTIDGKDTVMSPVSFRIAVRRLLGLPVFPTPVPCPLCQQWIYSATTPCAAERQETR